mgnify:CR=1 FL=1
MMLFLAYDAIFSDNLVLFACLPDHLDRKEQICCTIWMRKTFKNLSSGASSFGFLTFIWESPTLEWKQNNNTKADLFLIKSTTYTYIREMEATLSDDELSP